MRIKLMTLEHQSDYFGTLNFPVTPASVCRGIVPFLIGTTDEADDGMTRKNPCNPHHPWTSVIQT